MSDVFLVQLIAGLVVAACALGVALAAIAERQRTGKGPWQNSRNQFSTIWILYYMLRIYAPPAWVQTLPLCIIIPAVDVALALAYLLLAGYSLAYAYVESWTWRIAAQQTAALVLPAMFGLLVYRDIRDLHSMAWVWIIAGVLSLFLTPLFARLAFLDRRQQTDSPSGMRDFHLWRPGDP